METTTETAWLILRIVALALPAYAILLQAFVRMKPPGISKISRQYEVSIMAVVTMGPLALAGLISTIEIYPSVATGPVSYAVGLISISFIAIPGFLVYVWQSNKNLYEANFPENGKSLSEVSDKISRKYPKLTFATYLFGLVLGVYILISSFGVWYNALGVIQVVLSIVMLIVWTVPEEEFENE